MKIYTKTGDKGETGLLGGVRVQKYDLAICVCGELDETNSQIGLARSHGTGEAVDEALNTIQQDLFVIGSQVADCCSTKSVRAAQLSPHRVAQLEGLIDQFDAKLPAMDAFILPGGCLAGAQLHVARTVCRRAERRVVELKSKLESNQEIAHCAIYLNRLSDLLFVFARFVNHASNSPESKWLPQATNE